MGSCRTDRGVNCPGMFRSMSEEWFRSMSAVCIVACALDCPFRLAETVPMLSALSLTVWRITASGSCLYVLFAKGDCKRRLGFKLLAIMVTMQSCTPSRRLTGVSLADDSHRRRILYPLWSER